MAGVQASEVCNKILQGIKSSNLNFVINETPYSANICIRKRFVKEIVSSFDASLQNQTEFQEQNEKLKNQISELVAKLNDSEAKFATANDAVATLETKVQKSESKLSDMMKNSKFALDDKKEEIKLLNNVIKNHADEVSRIKNENRKLTKSAKVYDKEAYNLENKIANQGETIKTLKESVNILKADKNKLEKVIRKSNKTKAVAVDSNSNCIDKHQVETSA